MAIPIIRQLRCPFVAGKIRNSRTLLMRAARENKNPEAAATLQEQARLLGIQLESLPDVDKIEWLKDGAPIVPPSPARGFVRCCSTGMNPRSDIEHPQQEGVQSVDSLLCGFCGKFTVMPVWQAMPKDIA